MKDELSAAWEDLASSGDWSCLGRELLAGASTGNNIEEKESNLDGSPPPGGGGDFETDGDIKNGGGCRGVYFDHIRHLWRANWPEETIIMDRDSKRPVEVRRCTRTKGFSAKKFGFQESKRMAIAHRKTMITSGVIRKYIYQESGTSSPAASPTSPSGLMKKPARDKKRRKIDKPVSSPVVTCASSSTASSSSSPRESESPSAVAVPPPPPPLELMMCLDPQVTSVVGSNAPLNSTVAYDFTFL